MANDLTGIGFDINLDPVHKAIKAVDGLESSLNKVHGKKVKIDVEAPESKKTKDAVLADLAEITSAQARAAKAKRDLATAARQDQTKANLELDAETKKINIKLKTAEQEHKKSLLDTDRKYYEERLKNTVAGENAKATILKARADKLENTNKFSYQSSLLELDRRNKQMLQAEELHTSKLQDAAVKRAKMLAAAELAQAKVASEPSKQVLTEANIKYRESGTGMLDARAKSYEASTKAQEALAIKRAKDAEARDLTLKEAERRREERHLQQLEMLQVRKKAILDKGFSDTAQSASAFRTLMQGVRDVTFSLFAANTLSGFVSTFTQIADTMTNIASRLTLVSKSTEEAKSTFQELQSFSISTGIALEGVASSFVGIRRATKEAGYDTGEMTKLVEGLGKAAIVSGANASSFNSAMIQLTQGLSSGVLRGQEFNSISEQAPVVLEMMAKGLKGVNPEFDKLTAGGKDAVAALRAMSKEGKLTTDVVVKGMLGGLKDVDDQFNKMAPTFERSTTKFKEAFNKWLDSTVQGVEANKKFDESITALITNFSTLTTVATYAGAAVVTAMAGRGVNAVVNPVRENSATLNANIAAAKEAEVRATQNLVEAENRLAAATTARGRAYVMAGTEEHTAILREQADATKNVATATEVHGKAVKAVSLAQAEASLITRGLAATTKTLSGAFQALGGWTTVIIGAIWVLAANLDTLMAKMGNVAAKARVVGAEIRNALAEGDAATARARLKVLDTQVEGAYADYSKESGIRANISKSLSAGGGVFGISKEDLEAQDKVLKEKSQAFLNLQRERNKLRAEVEAATKAESEMAISGSKVSAETIGGIRLTYESGKLTSASKMAGNDVKTITSISEQFNKKNEALSTLKKQRADYVKSYEALKGTDKEVSKKDFDLTLGNIDKEIEAATKKIERKSGGGKAKRPELTAGLSQTLAIFKEQLSSLKELASVQEKLQGFTEATTLASIQQYEQKEISTKVDERAAKIQEDLSKKNLSAETRAQLLAQQKLVMSGEFENQLAAQLSATQALERSEQRQKEFSKTKLESMKLQNEYGKQLQEAQLMVGQLSNEDVKRSQMLQDLAVLRVEEGFNLLNVEQELADVKATGDEDSIIAAERRYSLLSEEYKLRLKAAEVKLDAYDKSKTFEAGFQRAWQTFKDEASDASKFGERVFTSLADSLADNFANVLQNQKVSFSDMFKSLQGEVLRFFARKFIMNIGVSMFGDDAGQSAGGIMGNAGGVYTNIASSFAMSGLGEKLGLSTVSSSTPYAANGFSTVGGMGDYAVTMPTSGSYLGGSTAYNIPMGGAGGAYSSTGAMVNTAGGSSLTPLGETFKSASQYAAYIPAVMDASQGKWGSSAGSALGTYLTAGNPLGTMLGSTLGGMVDDFFGGGGPDQRTAKFGSGASSALVSEGKSTGWTGESIFGTFRTYADKWFSGSEMTSAMGSFITSLEDMDTKLASSLGVGSTTASKVADELSKIDKEYNFGEQWTDFTTSSKAREQIAIDRYSTILNGIEDGWGEFVTGFKGTFDEFPTYLSSIVEAMKQFKDNALGLGDVFKEDITSISQFKTLTKGSETTAAAFQRLYGVFVVTNRVVESMGRSAETLNLSTSNLRQSLVDIAGGVSSLSGMLDSYYANYFTQDEQKAVKLDELSKVFKQMNLTLPKTREQFVGLVNSMNLSTESGQQMYVKLLSLSDAFASVTDTLTLTEAKSKVQDTFNKVVEILEESTKSLDTFAKAIRKFKVDLKLDKELSPYSVYDKYVMARDRLEEIQQKALAGDEEAKGLLEQSSRDFLAYSKEFNANSAQYMSDFQSVQDYLDKVEANTNAALSNAQAQLNAANSMVSGILEVNKSVLSLNDAMNALAAAVAAYAGLQNVPKVKPKTGTVTVDEKGVYSSSVTGQSVTTGAAVEFIQQNTASGNLQNIYGVATSNGFTSSQLEGLAQQAGYNVSASDIKSWAASQGLPTFASGGLHTGGMRLVGEDGPELEVTGASYIMDAQRTSKLLSSINQAPTATSNNDVRALTSLVSALMAEVKMLRAERKEDSVAARSQVAAIATEERQDRRDLYVRMGRNSAASL